jgi:glycosyl hydrolase family 42 (putative beta-galactosidase)
MKNKRIKQRKPNISSVRVKDREVLSLAAHLLAFKRWWVRHWKKLAIGLAAFVLLFTATMYGIARWYIHEQSKKPLKYGVTFIPAYAERLNLDPKETMRAMIDDLGVRQFRLVSYWSEGEPEPGQYDFSTLDWQFRLAEESGSKVSLAIGLRQPRWPECHMPPWAARLTKKEWAVELKEYMGAVIQRYKNSPALESYQLENEFFMKVFGICPDHTRERLVDEYQFVKSQDDTHPVVVSRSNNWVGIPVNEPTADVFAISVYKRVWDKTITKRYFEYPLPAWFYASLGGLGKIVTGKDLIIHELQAESWLPEGFSMDDPADIPEQNKSLNAERLKDRFEYGRATGLREIYAWGAEWWYWRKAIGNDPSLWNVAKEEFAKHD